MKNKNQMKALSEYKEYLQKVKHYKKGVKNAERLIHKINKQIKLCAKRGEYYLWYGVPTDVNFDLQYFTKYYEALGYCVNISGDHFWYGITVKWRD